VLLHYSTASGPFQPPPSQTHSYNIKSGWRWGNKKDTDTHKKQGSPLPVPKRAAKCFGKGSCAGASGSHCQWPTTMFTGPRGHSGSPQDYRVLFSSYYCWQSMRSHHSMGTENPHSLVPSTEAPPPPPGQWWKLQGPQGLHVMGLKLVVLQESWMVTADKLLVRMGSRDGDRESCLPQDPGTQHAKQHAETRHEACWHPAATLRMHLLQVKSKQSHLENPQRWKG
jgi:hypothetical protein